MVEDYRESSLKGRDKRFCFRNTAKGEGRLKATKSWV